MTLHVLASYNFTTKAACLASLAQGDCVLLAGDGVYLLQSAEALASFEANAKQLVVLREDLNSRLPNTTTTLAVISYADWVELSIAAGVVVSWY
ncbi:MAG: sulfurtransferase complex subunit TusB [Marinagarivorans sp.]